MLNKAILVLSLVATTFACSCLISTFEEQASSAPVLIRGIIHHEPKKFKEQQYEFIVKITHVYSCNKRLYPFRIGQKLRLVTGSTAACGIGIDSIKRKSEWIFAPQSIEHNVWSVQACSGPNQLWESLSELQKYRIEYCDYRTPEACIGCKNCKYVQVQCIRAPCPPVAVCLDKVECSELSRSACLENPSCRPVLATKCSSGYYGFEEEVGCINSDTFCAQSLTCASNPETGTRYTFKDSCVPKGWTPIYDQPCCESSAPSCSSIDPSKCSSYACRTIVGRKCYTQVEEKVGCGKIGLLCTQVITCAKSPVNGYTYIFNNGCTPAGWPTVSCPAGC